MGVTIDTILAQDGDSCEYPLVVTNDVPQIMPRIHEHIGEGTHGHVYSMATHFGNIYGREIPESFIWRRMRILAGQRILDVPMNEFALEVAIQLHASSMGISPNVYNA